MVHTLATDDIAGGLISVGLGRRCGDNPHFPLERARICPGPFGEQMQSVGHVCGVRDSHVWRPFPRLLTGFSIFRASGWFSRWLFEVSLMWGDA